jgi:putative transposase
MLRRERFVINSIRVQRIYDAHGLQVRVRKKRGVRHVRGNVVEPVTRSNERWSLDFVSDTLSNGRRFRALTIVDDYFRECIDIEADFSRLRSNRDILTRNAIQRGASHGVLKTDNGSEFTTDRILEWSALAGVAPPLHDPGRLTQNGSVESLTAGFETSPQRTRLSDGLSRAPCDPGMAQPKSRHTSLDGFTPNESIEQHCRNH